MCSLKEHHYPTTKLGTLPRSLYHLLIKLLTILIQLASIRWPKHYMVTVNSLPPSLRHTFKTVSGCKYISLRNMQKSATPSWPLEAHSLLKKEISLKGALLSYTLIHLQKHNTIQYTCIIHNIRICTSVGR